jgi:hypothetical protein
VADLGPWEPLTTGAVQDLLADAPFPWWLAGGCSLDRLVGHCTRHHADIELVLPLLTPVETAWLRDALGATAPEHPWLERLGTGAGT